MPEIRYWNYLLESIDVTYKFKTNVLKSLDGEQRFRNRSQPRMVYKLTSKFSDADLEAAETLLRDQMSDTAAYRGKLYIPRPDQGLPAEVVPASYVLPADSPSDYWYGANDSSTLYTDTWATNLVTASGDNASAFLDEAVEGGETSPTQINFDPTKLREHHKQRPCVFQAGTDIITMGDTLAFESNELGVIVSGADNPFLTYTGSLIGLFYPYELCRLIAPPEIVRSGYNNNTITLTVMSLSWVSNLDPLNPTLTLDEFGYPLVDFLPVYKTSYSDTIVLPEQIIDYTGIAGFELTGLGLDHLSNRGFSYDNLDEYNLLQDFLEYVEGKYKKFYAFDDSTSTSREAFRLNEDEITFNNSSVAGSGKVSMPFKKLEGNNE